VSGAPDARQDDHGRAVRGQEQLTRTGVAPAAQRHRLAADNQRQPHRTGLLALDVGSSVSSLSAFIGGEVFTMIRTDIGQGKSAADLLETAGIEAVRRWLPFYATDDEVLGYALNKMLRPATVPETLRDLYLEHA